MATGWNTLDLKRTVFACYDRERVVEDHQVALHPWVNIASQWQWATFRNELQGSCLRIRGQNLVEWRIRECGIADVVIHGIA